jgi:hypothetical protein
MPNPRFHVIPGLASIPGAPYGNAGPIFKLPAIPNIYDYRSATPGFVVSATTGALVAFANGTASSFIHLRGFLEFLININIANITADALCFYDVNQNFISSMSAGNVAAGTVITAPVGTVYIRFWYTTSSIVPNTVTPSTVMVSPGTILPAIFTPFTLP